MFGATRTTCSSSSGALGPLHWRSEQPKARPTYRFEAPAHNRYLGVSTNQGQLIQTPSSRVLIRRTTTKSNPKSWKQPYSSHTDQLQTSAVSTKSPSKRTLAPVYRTPKMCKQPYLNLHPHLHLHLSLSLYPLFKRPSQGNLYIYTYLYIYIL